MPFVVLVLSFEGRLVDSSGCDDVAERVLFLVATAALLAGLWWAGARGRVAVAALAATAAAAVAAAADSEIAVTLVDPVVVATLLGIVLSPVLVILVLSRRLSLDRAVLAVGWASVWLAVPGTFVFLGFVCNGLD